VQDEYDGGRLGRGRRDRFETGEGVRHSTSFLSAGVLSQPRTWSASESDVTPRRTAGCDETIVPGHGMIREMIKV
jgi:hypothetical protein